MNRVMKHFRKLPGVVCSNGGQETGAHVFEFMSPKAPATLLTHALSLLTAELAISLEPKVVHLKQ